MIIDALTKKIESKDKLCKPGIATFLNPFSYMLVRSRPELMKKFDYIFIDGQWLCYFLKFFKIVNVGRCSFDNTSAAPIVFSKFNEEAKKVAIVGSDIESCQKFGSYLASSYPNLNLVFLRNGYFDDEKDVQKCCNEIAQLEPDLVVVGMGAVKQEQFLVQLKETGWKGVGYTCGGFIHQTASKGHVYYPSWINKMNLRFVYRIWDEPKLIARYTIDYSKFAFTFVYDSFLFHKKKLRA